MDKIKELNLVFENCEVASIPVEYINYLTIRVQEKVLTLHNYLESNTISEYETCKILIELDLKYLKSSYSFMGDYKNDRENLLERIKYNDITQIEIVEENKSKTFYVVWEDGETEFDNKLQKYFEYDNALIVDIGGISDE